MSITPAELRNATWAQVQEHITADMRRVHDAWRDFGPGTTRMIAARSGASLLTLRPRTTDLYQVGLVECVGREGNEGIYEFRSDAQAQATEAWKEERRSHRQTTRATVGAPPVFKSRKELVRWAASVMGSEAKIQRLKRRHAPSLGGRQLELLTA